MSIPIHWDRRAFNRQALKLSLLKKEAASATLKAEGKLFVRDCVAMTPPIGPNPIQEFSDTQSQRRRGEKAVSKDINKLFVSARGLKIMEQARNAKLERDLERAIKYGRVDDVAAILKKIGLNYAGVALEASEQYLTEHRNSRGRVMKGYRQFILRSQTIERIRKKKMDDVGKAKGGWVEPAEALGLKLPAWITRHRGQPGMFKDETNNRENPSITIGNLISWAQQFEGRIGIIGNALSLRLASMKKRVEILIKKGY